MQEAETRVRCPWVRIGDVAYARYHDEDGVPIADDQALFEARARGLSGGALVAHDPDEARASGGVPWLRAGGHRTVWTERHRAADAGRGDRAQPHEDRSRHRQCACLPTARRANTFGGVPLGFLDGRPLDSRCKSLADVPAETGQSRRISKALKVEGFRFVGPTTIYAFMQSVGMVNDHLVACHHYPECAALQRAFVAPKRQAT